MDSMSIFLSFLFASIISILWVNGIDNMNKNYPNYKGEDFLKDYTNEEEKDTLSI